MEWDHPRFWQQQKTWCQPHVMRDDARKARYPYQRRGRFRLRLGLGRLHRLASEPMSRFAVDACDRIQEGAGRHLPSAAISVYQGLLETACFGLECCKIAADAEHCRGSVFLIFRREALMLGATAVALHVDGNNTIRIFTAEIPNQIIQATIPTDDQRCLGGDGFPACEAETLVF